MKTWPYNDWVFGVTPKGMPGILQHNIQFVQRAKGFSYWPITHVGICGPDGTGVEMAWPRGRVIDIRATYAERYNIFYSHLADFNQSGLFNAGVHQMLRSPYAGLQLLGVILKYQFRWDIYTHLPMAIQETLKICSEGVMRSYLDLSISFQPEIKIEYSLPAAFFKDMFLIEEDETNGPLAPSVSSARFGSFPEQIRLRGVKCIS